MKVLFRSQEIAEPLVKAYSAPHYTSPSPVAPYDATSHIGQYAIVGATLAKTMTENGLLMVEEHRIQMISINTAYEKHFVPGKLVYRNSHHDEITADAPSDPSNDDRIGHIVGFAARPTLITTSTGMELRFNPLLVRWGGAAHKYRQPYAYSTSEVMLYVHKNASGGDHPPVSNTTVGDSSQAG